jgi:hypothetical protein
MDLTWGWLMIAGIGWRLRVLVPIHKFLFVQKLLDGSCYHVLFFQPMRSGIEFDLSIRCAADHERHSCGGVRSLRYSRSVLLDQGSCHCEYVSLKR